VVFSSQIFLFYFLPLALAAYFLVPVRARQLVLAVLSYGFYGWSNPAFMGLMFVSTLVDYACGLVIGRNGEPGASPAADTPRERSRRTALMVSIITNLSLLGFFKYFNFAAENYRSLTNWLGVSSGTMDFALEVTLPLGISFYTFQSMSYTIDVYRRDARAIRNFIDFVCYVSMFPQLVAGPIVRFQTVADQIHRRSHTITKFARGTAIFCLGLGKKVLLANPCGKVADMAFSASALNPLEAWMGAVAYAFQIYFDFSGYSDMAIGLGLMLGFSFPVNFSSPYRAHSVTDFWRRWHISLSSWLRDNLYIPLGGNRLGIGRTYANLATVMLLGGLWHGASWNFVIWGGVHGALLAAERALSGFRLRVPRPAGMVATFLVVTLAWVFFRAEDLPAAIGYFGFMFGVGSDTAGAGLVSGVMLQPYYLVALLVAGVVVWTQPTTLTWTHQIGWGKILWVLAVFWLSVAALTVQSFNPFIYFIF
jgi:alginate O-acetyltransferase complex protein AlgI